MSDKNESEDLDVSEDTIDICADTMAGDLIQLVIDELKAAPDIWQKMSEDTQYWVIDRVRHRVTDAINQAVCMIASDSRDVITADLEQITAKDGIKAVCVLAKHDPNRHALLDSVGKPVLIVVASAEPYLGGDVPKPEPAQRRLELVEAADDTPVADNGLATAEAAKSWPQ
jgi:hypothetical protein